MTEPASATPRQAGAFVRAAALLLAVLLLGPQPNVLPLAQALAQAREAQQAQDYPAAADALSEAAARMPYSASVIYRSGLAAISAGRFEEAIRRIQAAAAIDGWTPARRVALGDAYFGLGDRDNAIAQWELALADLPDDDGLLARLANNYEAAGRYADAAEALNRLAELRGNDPSVLYRLALLTAAATPAEALARLALVADLAPEYAPTLRALMESIEIGLGAGDSAYTYTLVGYQFIQMQEWGLAEQALRQAVSLNPEYADAHAYLGLAMDRLGQDGLEAYETAVRLKPDSPLYQYLLGLHWRRFGDSNTALPYLRTAQALDPDNPATAAEIGGAYASLGQLAEAEVWLTQAVSLAPQNPQFWLLLARFYVDYEYLVAENGLPAARQAVSLAPQNPLALDALGYALVLTGDAANGQEMLERALALNPELASAYYHLGQLFMRQGNREAADTALSQALALDPEGRYGGLALRALAELGP